MQLKDDMREQATGTSRETFVDSFKESLFDIDITAEKVSNNIHEYMRKALILNLYKNDFQKDINDYYAFLLPWIFPTIIGRHLFRHNIDDQIIERFNHLLVSFLGVNS